MAWIELHQALPTHRKTLALADALDIEPVQVVGHLVCLWLWALDNAPSGDLSPTSQRTLARAAHWGGDPMMFHAALVAAGFVDSENQIHDWDDYAGRLVERRETEKERSRQRRAALRQVDHTTPNGRPPDDQQTAVGTGHNPTGPTGPTRFARNAHTRESNGRESDIPDPPDRFEDPVS